MRCIVISLERAGARRRAIAPQFASLGLEYEFFDAVDGDRLTAAQLASGRSPDAKEGGRR